ncbi:MAG TPA: hypothetical protein PKA06_16330, partial [Gemmatales bacterium]|nr:hypothetical protein [Gemmatales bacterium]
WLLLWMGGHWAFVGGLLLLLGINQNHEILHVFVALTPPLVLGISANPISNPSFGDDLPGTEYKQHYIYMLGLVIYLLVAVVFYFLAVHRFYLRTGRIHSLKR